MTDLDKQMLVNTKVHLQRLQELQQAFQLVATTAGTVSKSADSSTLLVMGGPLVLEDHQYVRALLDIVNYNRTADGPLLAMMSGKVQAVIQISDQRRRPIEAFLLRRIRSRKSASKGAAALLETIREAVLCVPVFDEERIATGRRYRTVTLNSDTAVAYVMLLLLDQELPYGERLRRCELPACRKYFLLDPSDPALPRRYCCKAHSEEGERYKTRERVRKHRQGPPARATARKHK